MLKIWNIAKYDLLKIFRDKAGFLFLLLLPIIFTALMGMAYGSSGGSSEAPKIPIGVSNHDSSDTAQRLVDTISKDKSISVQLLDDDKLYKNVKDAEIDIGFIIPEGFGDSLRQNNKNVEIKAVKLPSSSDYVAIEGIVNTALSKLMLKDEAIDFIIETAYLTGMSQETLEGKVSDCIDRELENPVASVQVRAYGADDNTVKFDGKATSSIGVAIMFVMFTVVLGGAGLILEEKKTNTWARLEITPTGRYTILMGKVLGTFLKGWFQVAFLILFGKYVMRVNWGNSILSVVVIISIYLLSVIAMGLLMAAFVKTNAQLGSISAIVIVCTSMLSGCYWPIDMTPDSMQMVARMFPQYWAIKGLTGAVVGGTGLDAAIQPVLALILLGIIYFILSVLVTSLKGGMLPWKAASIKG